MRSGVLNHTFGHFGQLAPCRAQFREGKFQMLLRVVVLLFFRFAAECLQVAVDRDTKAIDLTYDRSDLVNSFGFHCSISSQRLPRCDFPSCQGIAAADVTCVTRKGISSNTHP